MADEVPKSDTIESLLAEGRTYPPPAEFTATALLSDTAVYAEAEADIEGFWAEQAGELLDWFEPWHTVLEWDLPFAKWFVGGKLNAAYNCLDRHVDAGRGDKVAYHWEGEPGDTRTITYAELLHDVAAARQRAEGPRRREGRPGQHLPRHGAGAADGAARVRAHRRRPLRGVRRLLRPTRCRDRIQDAEAKVLITGDGAVAARAASCR